ncbi:MAG: sn-glycerol-3-phosphate ABC transporter ATP-binding protein UgpC [Lautropia sp.]|nr:sn-glycerol-3-phosphate ABC transporter ATP-binding protein UgpC [Lautropia sp.]
MSGLELKNVRKSFGNTHVIHGVDLRIEPGEFCVFVGPSGCGKSTLLRMIAGLEDISDGELSIGGQPMNDVDPAQRGVAMVFQSYALYPHLSVRENMGFGLRFDKTPKDEIKRRVEEVAKVLKLSHLLDRKPKALSGGQRQRVAIGRAIVRKPKVFLFDEPLSNLDAELRVNMRVEIARLHQDLGTTIIYVTHDQIEAMTLADKIVVLRAGRVEQVGRPLDLYDDPDNTFIAGFIGSPRMNMLPGTIHSVTGNSVSVSLDEFEQTVFEKELNTTRPDIGDSVMVGIRPEHFSPSEHTEASEKVRLPLSTDVVEHLGGESYVYARNGRNTRLILKMPDAREIKSRQPMTASFQPERAYLFDAQGKRLR